MMVSKSENDAVVSAPLLPGLMLMPGRTLSGSGCAARLVPECDCFGARGLVVHGKSLGKTGLLAKILGAAADRQSVIPWEHPGGEPTLDELEELLKAARTHRAKWIAGVGGGSVIDLGKSCAGLFHAARNPVFYHDGAGVESNGIPFAAIPTTAGTGSEATPNAVLTNSDTCRKKSIRDDRFVPRLVILDERLLESCPKEVVAFSGLDALTQAVEAYTSRNACWISDELALKSLSLIKENIEEVYEGGSAAARSRLLAGSYLGGLALANARLGVVHGLAHPIGARYHLPHGQACAICLPHAIEFNREMIGSKYDRMSVAAGGDLLDSVNSLLDRFGIESPLKGRPIRDKASIIEETLASGSTAANPMPVTAADVEWFLKRIFNPEKSS